MRIVKVDEMEFLLCVKNKVWGSNRSILKTWEEDSLLLFKVGDKVAGLARISCDYFESKEIVWDTDLYEHRRCIEFLIIFKKSDRINAEPNIKNIFVNEWGKSYGHGIINKMRISKKNKEIILDLLSKKPNSLKYYNKNIDNLIKEEKENRDKEQAMYLKGLLKSSSLKYKKKRINI